MPTQAQLKTYRSYRQKKFRDADEVIVIEGAKLVEETLAADRLEILQVLARQEFYEQHQTLLDHFPTEVAGSKTLDRLTNFRSAGSVWLLARRPSFSIDPEFINSGLTLYLDGVQDPGNVGTIWRIADWFGVKHLIASEQTADFWNPKTLQASMGAFLRVTTDRCELSEFRKRFPDPTLCGATMSGKSLFETELPKPALLVIGSEGRGMSSSVEAALDLRLNIPRAPGGGAESLNAAVATGILVASWQNIR